MRNGRNAKSPAFQFYPGDFLADRNVAAMTMEERGVYVTLLCFQWIDGPLPSDLGKLARMVHIAPEAFARLWEALGPCFDMATGTTIANGRMERERGFQAEGRSKRLEASRIAQEARLRLESSSNRARTEHDSSPPLDPTPYAPHPTPQALPPTPDSLRPTKKRGAPRPTLELAEQELPSHLDREDVRVALSEYQAIRAENHHPPLKQTGWGQRLRELEKLTAPQVILALQQNAPHQGWYGLKTDKPSYRRPEPEPPKYLDLDAHFAAEDARAAARKEAQ